MIAHYNKLMFCALFFLICLSNKLSATVDKESKSCDTTATECITEHLKTIKNLLLVGTGSAAGIVAGTCCGIFAAAAGLTGLNLALHPHELKKAVVVPGRPVATLGYCVAPLIFTLGGWLLATKLVRYLPQKSILYDKFSEFFIPGMLLGAGYGCFIKAENIRLIRR